MMKYSFLVLLVFLLFVPFVKAQNLQFCEDGAQTTRDMLPALPLHDHIENQPAFSPILAVQSIDLVQGYNTISTNLSVTMDDIKEALLVAIGLVDGIKIIVQNGTSSTFQTRINSWRGNVTDWDVTQGMTIYVPNNPEVAFTLEGAPLGHVAIPLAPGYNLVTYSGNNETAFGTALAEFEAVNGDKVISPDGYIATYNGGSWRGSLSSQTLKPGVGYTIYSASETTRTITLR